MSPTYDQPPFWFSQAFVAGIPFALLMMLGGVFQSLPLLLAGLVPLLVFIGASLTWSRRHQVR